MKAEDVIPLENTGTVDARMKKARDWSMVDLHTGAQAFTLTRDLLEEKKTFEDETAQSEVAPGVPDSQQATCGGSGGWVAICPVDKEEVGRVRAEDNRLSTSSFGGLVAAAVVAEGSEVGMRVDGAAAVRAVAEIVPMVGSENVPDPLDGNRVSLEGRGARPGGTPPKMRDFVDTPAAVRAAECAGYATPKSVGVEDIGSASSSGLGARVRASIGCVAVVPSNELGKMGEKRQRGAEKVSSVEDTRAGSTSRRSPRLTRLTRVRRRAHVPQKEDEEFVEVDHKLTCLGNTSEEEKLLAKKVERKRNSGNSLRGNKTTKPKGKEVKRKTKSRDSAKGKETKKPKGQKDKTERERCGRNSAADVLPDPLAAMRNRTGDFGPGMGNEGPDGGPLY